MQLKIGSEVPHLICMGCIFQTNITSLIKRKSTEDLDLDELKKNVSIEENSVTQTELISEIKDLNNDLYLRISIYNLPKASK